jgi:hypothetical protein
MFSRVLSLLLLGFVVYGTTIAAAHRHGRIVNTDSSLTKSISQPNGTSSLNGQRGCNECALCQLHLYSSTALITIRAGVAPLSTRIEHQNPEPTVFKSSVTTPKKGRAPPLAN